MEKSYKIRIYPNEQQRILIHKTFGCCRFVFNYYLNKRTRLYNEEHKNFSYSKCCEDLTLLKKNENYSWLKEVDSVALQCSLQNLDWAFVNFFNGKHYPKYKKKTHSFRYKTKMTHNNIKVFDTHIQLPKLGLVKYKGSYNVQGRILNVIVSQEPSGEYYAIICTTNHDVISLQQTNKQIGIDLGINDYCVTSDGEIYNNPRYFKKSEDKIKKLHKSLRRKTPGGKNWEKARVRLAKAYKKITNQKEDYLHKLSKQLINENDYLAIEDLNVKDLLTSADGTTNKVKTATRRAMLDVSWGKFIRFLNYKSKFYGRTLVKIPQEYASSQYCHVCGHKNVNLNKNYSKEWICPCCGTYLQRDINAAINILNESLLIAT